MWTVKPWDNRAFGLLIAEGHDRVAVMDSTLPGLKVEANARLIAAAPALLAALNKLLAYSEATTDTSSECVQAEDMARAAIALAKGEA